MVPVAPLWSTRMSKRMRCTLPLLNSASLVGIERVHLRLPPSGVVVRLASHRSARQVDVNHRWNGVHEADVEAKRVLHAARRGDDVVYRNGGACGHHAADWIPAHWHVLHEGGKGAARHLDVGAGAAEHALAGSVHVDSVGAAVGQGEKVARAGLLKAAGAKWVGHLDGRPALALCQKL